MIRVKIAEFKDGLSKYLRGVRNGGELVIMDRQTPVARLSPYEDKADDGLIIVPAKKSSLGLKNIRGIKPRKKIDVLKLLQEDRGED